MGRGSQFKTIWSYNWDPTVAATQSASILHVVGRQDEVWAYSCTAVLAINKAVLASSYMYYMYEYMYM